MKLKIAGMLTLIILLLAFGGHVAFAADPDPGLNVDIAVVGDNTNTTVTVEGDNPQTAVGIDGDNSKTNVAVTGDNGVVTINGKVPFQSYSYSYVSIYDDTQLKKAIADVNSAIANLNTVFGVLNSIVSVDDATLKKVQEDLSITIDAVAKLIILTEQQKQFNTDVINNLQTLQAALNGLQSDLTTYGKVTQEKIDQINQVLDSQAAKAAALKASTEGSILALRNTDSDLQNTDAALKERITNLTSVTERGLESNHQSITDTKNELKVVTIVLSSLVGLLLVGCGGMVYILRRRKQG